MVGFALTQTAWGRHVYAVGDDAEAARLSGIRIDRGAAERLPVRRASSSGIAAWILIGRAGVGQHRTA